MVEISGNATHGDVSSSPTRGGKRGKRGRSLDTTVKEHVSMFGAWWWVDDRATTGNPARQNGMYSSRTPSRRSRDTFALKPARVHVLQRDQQGGPLVDREKASTGEILWKMRRSLR